MARSDESEPEDRDTVERDALLLAQTYTSQETKVRRYWTLCHS